MLLSIVAQVPEIDFLSHVQTLPQCQDARGILQQVINRRSQPQQIEVACVLQRTHQFMQIHYWLLRTHDVRTRNHDSPSNASRQPLR